MLALYGYGNIISFGVLGDGDQWGGRDGSK